MGLKKELHTWPKAPANLILWGNPPSMQLYVIVVDWWCCRHHAADADACGSLQAWFSEPLPPPDTSSLRSTRTSRLLTCVLTWPRFTSHSEGRTGLMTSSCWARVMLDMDTKISFQTEAQRLSTRFLLGLSKQSANDGGCGLVNTLLVSETGDLLFNTNRFSYWVCVNGNW